jgi:signal transduction histidine kinase
VSEKKRLLLLVLIMAVACLTVTGITIFVLYRTALQEQRDILVRIVRNHARLIEEAAKLDAVRSGDGRGGAAGTLVTQILNAHKTFEGIGHTGEFTLARREGGNIVFLLSHRYQDFNKPKPVPMKSELAEPMRRALLGYSGNMTGLDYRGEAVLAAYEPIPSLKWGLVAKVDLAELRIPFTRAGTMAVGIATVVVLVGALLFLRITNPILEQLREHSKHLTSLVMSLRVSEQELQNARDGLEVRVAERASELVKANEDLGLEVKHRARAEERLRVLWGIAGMIDAPDKELYDHILQGTLQMTQSKYAFYGFMNSDESVLSMYSWSKEALKECQMSQKPIDYPVSSAGIWAEAIRQRRVIVVNDYQADNVGKLGIPEGHVQLTRILAIPVFGYGRIVSVVVAANKSIDYDDEDVRQLEAFASGVQLIIDQRKTEQSLRTSEKECRLLSRQVIEAQEKERKRIAREIHDAIGQSLAAIKYRAESYAMATDEDAAARTDSLRSIVRMLREAMEEVRKIQNDLRPAYLDLMGILETISDFSARFETTYSQIKVDARIEVSEEDVPEYLKAPMFRIIQEAMNNVAKHSSASQVALSLQRTKYKLELIVQDNGLGFAVEKKPQIDAEGKGLGLFSMKERIELTGGHLELISAPGKGTTVHASWPLDAEPSVS